MVPPGGPRALLTAPCDFSQALQSLAAPNSFWWPLQLSRVSRGPRCLPRSQMLPMPRISNDPLRARIPLRLPVPPMAQTSQDFVHLRAQYFFFLLMAKYFFLVLCRLLQTRKKQNH
jgi:hypothetical protein